MQHNKDDNLTPKRKYSQLSPEQQINNINMNAILEIIKTTINSNLNEKLQVLPTKADIEEIKTDISSVCSEMHSIREENKYLKEELTKVQKENESNKKDIEWLKRQIKSNKLYIEGLDSTKSPFAEVKKLLRDKLEVSVTITQVRKVFEKRGKWP